MRFCARSVCGKHAVASAGFDYKRKVVWIRDLFADRDPSYYDLCEAHTCSLTAPRGWRLEDHRTAPEPQSQLFG